MQTKLANLVTRKIAAKLQEAELNELLPTDTSATYWDVLYPSPRTSVRAGIAEGLAQASGNPRQANIFPMKHPLTSEIVTPFLGATIGAAGGGLIAGLGSHLAGAKGRTHSMLTALGIVAGAGLGGLTSNVLQRLRLNRRYKKIKALAKNADLDPSKIVTGKKQWLVPETKNRGRVGLKDLLYYREGHPDEFIFSSKFDDYIGSYTLPQLSDALSGKAPRNSAKIFSIAQTMRENRKAEAARQRLAAKGVA